MEKLKESSQNLKSRCFLPCNWENKVQCFTSMKFDVAEGILACLVAFILSASEIHIRLGEINQKYLFPVDYLLKTAGCFSSWHLVILKVTW